MLLCLVTDTIHNSPLDALPPTEHLVEVVRSAIAEGVDMMQLREKTADTRTFIERALALRILLRGTG